MTTNREVCAVCLHANVSHVDDGCRVVVMKDGATKSCGCPIFVSREPLPINGTGDPADADTVIIVPDDKAMFGRRYHEKHTGKEIPFGTYPNIDWS